MTAPVRWCTASPLALAVATEYGGYPIFAVSLSDYLRSPLLTLECSLQKEYARNRM